MVRSHGALLGSENKNKREHELTDNFSRATVPPSRNATLDDVMHFETEPDVPIEIGMSPTKNGMCYIYE